MRKLTDVAIRKPLTAGRYGDGNGLYLLVGPNGGKSWVFRFKANNRERGMGLGPYPLVTLAEAREKALECRKVKVSGGDPLAMRHAERDEKRDALRRATSFQDCAEQYLETHEVAWKNPKHRQQWRNTLSTYAYPKIGSTAVGAINVPSVLSVIQPLWPTRPETASRLRGRIEAILDWARVKGLREGENPARWKGNLDYALPKKSKVRKVKHFAALPYANIPDFIVQLRQTHGVTAMALEFLILTAARTTEVLLARWSEIDLQNEVWTIPAERMKAGREHRIPLSKASISVLRRALETNLGLALVFGGKGAAAPLSNMSALMQVRRLRPGVTVHGFRSTFRDWAAETTTYSNEVVEMALAHTISNAVEAAYRRGDLFDKRRNLMEEWSRYLLSRTTVLVESQS